MSISPKDSLCSCCIKLQLGVAHCSILLCKIYKIIFSSFGLSVMVLDFSFLATEAMHVSRFLAWWEWNLGLRISHYSDWYKYKYVYYKVVMNWKLYNMLWNLIWGTIKPHTSSTTVARKEKSSTITDSPKDEKIIL
jgi:hypothetical protein